MNIRKRNPFLHWALIMVTLGQYSFVWAYLMAKDVNRLQGENRIELKRSTRRFLVQYAIHIFGFIGIALFFLRNGETSQAWIYNLLFVAFFANALALLVFFLNKLTDIASETRRLSKSESPPDIAVIILSFFYMVSLPWIQMALNKLRDKQSVHATSASAPR